MSRLLAPAVGTVVFPAGLSVGPVLRSSTAFWAVALAIALALQPASSIAADTDAWPRFLGPTGNNVFPAADVVTTWSDTEHLLWKKTLPGYGASTPILFDGKMYLTFYTGYGTGDDGSREQLQNHLACLDPAQGDLLWDKAFAASSEERKYEGFVQEHGYCSASPVTDGKGLYAFFGCSGVVALTMSGEQRWQTNVGTKTHGFGSGASPVLYGDLLIVNASVESGDLVALRTSDGTEAWRATGIVMSWATPLLVTSPTGRDELIISMKNKLRAFDPSTGAELWSCDAIEDYICPSPVAQDGIVYAIGGRKSAAVAVKTGGSGDVTQSHRLWKVDMGSNVPSPVIVDDLLVWVDHSGKANAIKLETGEKVTQARLEDSGKTYATLTIAGDTMIAVTRDAGALVFERGAAFKPLAHNTFSDDSTVFNATPVVWNNRLYLRSNLAVYCIGK